MSKSRGNAKSYKAVLQELVSLSDTEWVYNLPDLPRPTDTNKEGRIKVGSLITERGKHKIILELKPAPINRALISDPHDRFFLLSIAGFKPLCGQTRDTGGPATQPETGRECSDYVVKLLRHGIRLQGVQYHFYGHSNSQLKSRTCFLFAGGKDEIERKINAFGDFSKMKTVQKKAKRIGLLFSDANVAMTVDPARCGDIPDVESQDYVFTDGCGLVAPRLARELARRLAIAFRGVRYTPSVFQIRYRGYKGVVTLDPRMKEWPLLKFRKSMKKFSGGDDYSFSIVEHSRPYKFGHLNDEVVLLLHSLGISNTTLLQKQQEHFEFLKSAAVDARSCFRFLSCINQFTLAETLLLDSLDEPTLRSKVMKLINTEHHKMVNKRGAQKCRILIPQSRILFGVCDAWDCLRDGECHVRVTHDSDGQPRTVTDTEVLVTRNPCSHPGDLQKFRAVQKHELSHLVDCIVFSTKGRRPAADLMSGGDLDGDAFFVCWDPDIVPSTVAEPAEYPGPEEPMSFKPITDDDRLVYFARYTNASLGRVKNLFLDWAKARGPMSPECQELNRLFSTCVDGNRIKIPNRLQEPPQAPPDALPFILDELHEAAGKAVGEWQRKSSSGGIKLACDGYSLEAMELFLSRDDLAISEFELVKLAWKWCGENGFAFQDLLHFFDFNLLNAEEKTWVLAQLPSPEDHVSLVQNALCQSHLLAEPELHDSKLHHPGIRWKRVFSSATTDRLATFLDVASHALATFHRKLLVYRVDERLTLGIYIPQKIDAARDTRVDDRVRMLAFPHTKGKETASRLCLPTKVDYHLYHDDNMFQLFQGRRGNTWVWIGRGPSDETRYKNTKSKGDRRRQRQETIDQGVNYDFRVSVALDKFSRHLQTHVGRVNRNGVLAAEIYVITNRDVKSMRNLDLWLEYVDTQQVIPLFEQNAREYKIPDLGEVDWSLVPNYITQVARKEAFILMLAFDSREQYAHLFSWLSEKNQVELLVRSFDFLLSKLGDGETTVVDPKSMLEEMLLTVRHCPVLAVCFARMDSWERLHSVLSSVLEVHAEDLLKAIILSANTADELIIGPFIKILQRCKTLSIAAVGRLVKLIALAVKSPDLAMDLLVEGLERESFAVIPHHPSVINRTIRSLSGITIDHICEASEQGSFREDLLQLKRLPDDATTDGYPVVEVQFRIDSRGGVPEKSAHVRLCAASPPSNSVSGRAYSMDALVLESSDGLAKLQCFHPVPSYVEDCSWKLKVCGPFVSAKTMLDAVLDLALDPDNCCALSGAILGRKGNAVGDSFAKSDVAYTPLKGLNDSQNSAVRSALACSLTCLWGPPGTGKTHTIVEIIRQLLERHKESRMLVTAPTHNAVDNVMRRYLAEMKGTTPTATAIRVSTEVRKVSEDLKKHTVDAMVGKDIHTNYDALRKAKKMVTKANLIFTTCIGAGLGLLRDQSFEMVIIDEASQLTEPASLVPLVKGCRKAVLVGDHVQLRPTVQPHALLVDFDVSLFERLYVPPQGCGGSSSAGVSDDIARVMLDEQYRMHGSIAKFTAREFYEDRLKTGVPDNARPMFESRFPWPQAGPGPGNLGSQIKGSNQYSRMVFVECDSLEDLGQKSKSNLRQAALCHRVVELLRKPKDSGSQPQPQSSALQPLSEGRISRDNGRIGGTSAPPSEEPAAEPSIAVLTPYTRQADLLKQKLGGFYRVEVSSIDGFQGKEADIVVFVTVRCNERHEIGFLKDMRRLNVALTRAKTGLIIIGNKKTLTTGTSDPQSAAVWGRLLSSMVELQLDAEGR